MSGVHLRKAMMAMAKALKLGEGWCAPRGTENLGVVPQAQRFDLESAPRMSHALLWSVGLHLAAFAVVGSFLAHHVMAVAPRGGAPETVIELGLGGLAGSRENRIARGREDGIQGAHEVEDSESKPAHDASAPPLAPKTTEPNAQEPSAPIESVATPKVTNLDATPVSPIERVPAPVVKEMKAEVAQEKTNETVIEKTIETAIEKTESVVPKLSEQSQARKTTKAIKATEPIKPLKHPTPKAKAKATPHKAKSSTKPVDQPITLTQALPTSSTSQANATTTPSTNAAETAPLGTALGGGRGPSALVGSGDGLKKLATGDGDAAFIDNGDGTYRLNGDGALTVTILEDARPLYPRRARSVGYSQVVRVKVRFVVLEDGSVARAQVLSQKVPPLDFESAALKAISQMRFAPITRLGLPVKVTFVKTIVFVP